MIMNFSIFILVFLHLCCLSLFMLRFGVCTDIVCIPSERDTLLKLKHHLKDPSNRLSSWNATVNSNCCQWAGVICNNVTAHVVELHLNTPEPNVDPFIYCQIDYEAYEAYTRLMFGGEINPCLVDLKHLNYLDLSGNDFGGMPIPSFLGTMTSLTHLNLSDAGFSGKIPYQIGNLSNLLSLDLTSVYSLFAENFDWLSSLSKLEYLDLRGADLSKSFHGLHTLQALPSLIHLGLSECTLPHSDQPSLLNFSSLLTLDLSEISYYSATSFVPKWAFGLKKLVSLILSFSNFEGPIPDGLQNLTLIENLDLHHNSFSSSIPDWLYNLHHLKFLNLAENNLHGTISDALGNLTSLVGLDLSYNQLEGTIPTSLGNLCKLREIDFSHVKLNQQVNEIVEILAPCISHGLTTLGLASSQVTGNLTGQIGNFKNIVTLNFYNNSIGGNPFESLRSLSKLSHLYIADNHFQGLVKEDDLANLTSLKVLSASGNNFTLKVDPNWLPSFQLTILDMSSWQLGPNFPSWIQSQNKLTYLDMSNTKILDYVPTSFWEACSHACYLNLSRNHLHGELGTTLKNPISINFVDLSTNHFCGKLPYLSNDVYWLDLSSNSFSKVMVDFLCKKQDKPMQLESLNLASNNLSGEIPDCWMIWPNLVDLNLQSNHFVGNLPPSFGSLVKLQSLQIRNNSLSGIFPTILKENNRLIFLDLGENNLSGTIPTWVGEKLSVMKILLLRSNNFSAHIPNEICHMSHLQVLDLAQNNLSGNIPSCFNRLNAMTQINKSTHPLIYYAANYSFVSLERSIVSVFLWLKGRGDEYRNFLGLVTSIDLSSNKLLGEIPREITDLNGLIFLNLSHNQLIGRIPPTIGNMGSLLSIDFSRNQLSGEIPPTISKLSFLSMLDLSYNHLKGKIPTGTQLQTFDASSFIGNNLCGPPLHVNCSSNGKIHSFDHNGKGSHRHGVNWYFVSMTFGFVVGFWLVIAPLFICRSWRYAYFHFLDHVWFKLQSFC